MINLLHGMRSTAVRFNDLYFVCRVLAIANVHRLSTHMSEKNKYKKRWMNKKPPIPIHSNQSINAKVVSSVERIAG